MADLAPWLAKHMKTLGVPELSDYIGALCEEADMTDVDLRERATATLESATDEPVAAFVDELVARWRETRSGASDDAAAKLLAADQHIKETKVLRGETADASAAREESLEERRRRQELVARYDEADEMEMDAEGKVIKFAAPKTSKQKGDVPAGVESNDNAERVKAEEAAKRQQAKEVSAKQKELIKKDDSKKVKEEAKQKRRDKAKKVERKGRGM